MTTKMHDKQQAELDNQERRRLTTLIANHVMRTLGQPGDLHSVQVRRLWENRYRVNVFVGPNAASAKVAHSYFLIADDGGNILASTPNLRRTYEPEPVSAC